MSEVTWNEWFPGYFKTQNRQSKWVIGKIVIPKELRCASSKKGNPSAGWGYLFYCSVSSIAEGMELMGQVFGPLLTRVFVDLGLDKVFGCC
jgi:hypothetical protein